MAYGASLQDVWLQVALFLRFQAHGISQSAHVVTARYQPHRGFYGRRSLLAHGEDEWFQRHASTSGSGDAAIRDVVKKYEASRNAKDANAVAEPFTPDSGQLVSSGEWRKGREALVRGTMASSAATGGKRTLTVESIRYLTGDVAIADARYDLTGLSGGEERHMWSTFLLTRSAEGWLIAAIRNMLPAVRCRLQDVRQRRDSRPTRLLAGSL